MWPFKKKQQYPLVSTRAVWANESDDELLSLPSMGDVDIESPIGFRINRVDNGYYVVAEYNNNGSNKVAYREKSRRLVFGRSKDVANYIKKEFDKLEEEIQIEKLKQ